jgi:hypothetical protein
MKILIAGDSYTFGHGCSDREHYFNVETKKWVGSNSNWNGPSEFCWASLLQKNYPNLTVVNKSVSGVDNTSILINILKSCQSSSFDLIIFAASFSTRKQIADSYNSDDIVTWIPNYTPKKMSTDYAMAVEYYVKYLSNNTIDLNLTASAILAAFGQASALNSKFIWSRPGSDLSTELLNSIVAHQITSIESFDFSGVNDSEIQATDHVHVNNLGHQIYFEKQIVPQLQKLNIIS